ncbi:NAD-glutamate dehydrogenase [Agarilytica rhodophyticola]|uniref:NAD-glutamate dehydrogenase n=1 Tax=Agarilytica rhodophyticola TaxID=1737490 RepID=UPI001FE6D992|nr:NAD-glutamate dehydrogenase [Agarilytica rhodophyticola]
MEINAGHVGDRAVLMKNYTSFLEGKLKATEAKSILEFAEFYLSFFPMDAWLGRELSDLHGFLYGLLHFIQPGITKAPNVQVFNPNLDEHGWMCGRTVITVLQKDMPFLVDSIRLELNRRDIPIHVVQSTVMSVKRNAKGGFVKVESDPAAVDADKTSKEALIYIETSLHTDEKELADIKRSVMNVLHDADKVVSDYRNILAKLEHICGNVAENHKSAAESISFLKWLQESHFTFLGYREYDVVRKGRKLGLQEKCEERLGIFHKIDGTSDVVDISSNPGMESFHKGKDVVFFSKSSTRSNIHRSVYPDYIVVKKYDDKGKVCGEVRFLGLFTYAVFNMSPTQIPILRQKVDAVVKRTGLDVQGYYGKNLLRVIENFPKEELFQSDQETLYQNIWSIASINERHVVRLIVRRDAFGSFVNCMVYVPRDLYNTRIRVKIEKLLGAALNSDECDSTTFFSESTLARAQFVFRIEDDKPVDVDVATLEAAIVDITKNWEEHLQIALVENYGETQGIQTFNDYHSAFSSGYQEQFDARSAVTDIRMLEALKDENDIAMNLYRPIGASEDNMRFKIMHLNQPMELSDIIPILENLGFRVLGEQPHKIEKMNGDVIWLHDFQLAFGLPVKVDVHAARGHFEEAFASTWRGKSESDAFNRLVLGARLNWREVTMLRAYANYLKQIGFNTTQEYIADTLVHHLDITRNLVALFKASFDPRVNKNEGVKDERIERLRTKVLDALDDVSNLNEDRVLRRYLDMISGTLRTNYFQKDKDDEDKSYISIKFSPRDIPDIPEPRPMFEIFVYSPRMEGVHLRGGKVARGGLRWSDRLQDYRTEVLGLVKAQQVKNAVIVPNGAKGGFVAKKLSKTMSRQEFLDEGIACYKIFIQGLLDITDNLVEGDVVAPESVIRKDPDDPYLVVAADKGTATFSDIANEISENNNFWLGDAFASGGSQGYDHKGMGITAKGAWISVQRHFREKGVDVQNEDFTVIGIGDMAGDVFGNGMLLSEHIRLMSAFNHLHIFIDPTPDSASSFIERKRLFETPGTSWEDYDKSLISKGGGVFSRAAKSIKITGAMKKAFNISADKLAPNDLISELLKAPVDLIWNGGIGTYVKASWETHSDVGDKANDSLRVNGNELRCKVFGEGGNLGLTQLGRVEFELNGGACNTDFIDNAAGVDCSDHEVNIKIVLDELVSNGDLTSKQRNKFLANMTDAVSDLVLQNNYRQTLSISLAEHSVSKRITEYRRFITFLEGEGRLDRQLEFLPSDETIVERQGHGKGLTRPELSVLISYAKVMMKEILIASDIADNAYIAKEIETAFPEKLIKKYSEEIHNHRLKREIVGTQVANDLINNLGITAGHRLLETTGASLADVARAYIISRDVFQFEKFQGYIKSLDNKVPAEFQYELMANMIRRVRRGTRWFLRNRRSGLNLAKEVAIFQEGLAGVQKNAQDVVTGQAQEEWQERRDYLSVNKVLDEWVLPLSMPGNLFSGLSIVEASICTKAKLKDASRVFFLLLDRLSLDWFATQISNVRVESYWQALARESYIDDLETQLRKLTVSLLRLKGKRDVEDMYSSWAEQNKYLVNRWRSMVNEVQSSQLTDYAMFSVALRELVDLVQATEQCESL